MWTVVYVSQKSEEIFKIKFMLDDNEIITRVRENQANENDSDVCYEIMVPAAELYVAQNLIISAEI